MVVFCSTSCVEDNYECSVVTRYIVVYCISLYTVHGPVIFGLVPTSFCKLVVVLCAVREKCFPKSSDRVII